MYNNCGLVTEKRQLIYLMVGLYHLKNEQIIAGLGKVIMVIFSYCRASFVPERVRVVMRVVSTTGLIPSLIR